MLYHHILKTIIASGICALLLFSCMSENHPKFHSYTHVTVYGTVLFTHSRQPIRDVTVQTIPSTSVEVTDVFGGFVLQEVLTARSYLFVLQYRNETIVTVFKFVSVYENPQYIIIEVDDAPSVSDAPATL